MFLYYGHSFYVTFITGFTQLIQVRLLSRALLRIIKWPKNFLGFFPTRAVLTFGNQMIHYV